MPMLSIYSKNGDMPVTVRDIIRTNPQTSFPDQFDPTTEGYKIVKYASPPPMQDNEYAVPALPVQHNDGALTQGWEVRRYTAEEMLVRADQKEAARVASIKAQIKALEDGQDRAVREAALGNTTYLQQIEDQIVALRAQI